MDAAQGSARLVESAQSVGPPMEVRMYLLRFDGEGSAVELARLRPCGHQVEARLGAPAPVVVNEAAEVGRWEAAVYLAVLEGGEVKQLARLSSFHEGLSGGSSREVAEEAPQNFDTNPTATLSPDQEGDVFRTLSLEDDDDDDEEEEVEAVVGISEEEDKEVDTSSQEEEEEGLVVGTYFSSSSSEEEEVVDTSSQEEEEEEGSEEELSSVKIRICPGLSRLVLVLFDAGNWRLTRGQHINWLQESEEANVLKLTGLVTEKCRNGNACPKIFSHWSQDSVFWLEFEGNLLNEKVMCAQFNSSMEDFRVLKILGDGATGKVYQCVYKNDHIHNVQYALKKMDILDDFDDIQAINGEEPRTLRDDLPYKDCEIDIEESWRMFEEITRGLQCIHRMGIMHRDLKPDNIFVGINERMKIGDMGHACWAENGELIRTPTPNRGTYLYMAPELDSEHVTIKADIYSIGVIFLELFHPFLTVYEKAKALTGLTNNLQPTDWKGDTKLLMQLTALCPSDRPSTEKILDYIAQRRKNIDSQ